MLTHERVALAGLAVLAAAVLISIIVINHPPLPEPGPELKCTEWHERILVRVDYGPTGVLRTCSQYTWSQR